MKCRPELKSLCRAYTGGDRALQGSDQQGQARAGWEASEDCATQPASQEETTGQVYVHVSGV